MSGRPTQRDRRGRESHPNFREVLGGPSEGPGEVWKPTWRPGRGLEAHPEVWKAHPDVRVGKGVSPGRPGGGRRPSQRFGRVREAPPGSPGGDGRPFRWTRSCWEALLEAREGSGVLHGGPGGVGNPSWRSGRVGQPTQRSGRGPEEQPDVREAHTKFREGSVGSHGGLVGVGSTTRRSGRGQEAHPEVQ